MMQSGLSRELFETWCSDPKNGVIIAGYCVEGTLAKTILSEPEEITTMSGTKLPLNMSVDYISFSAHTDYQQTSEFIRLLKPSNVVLVHGEQNEMFRLKSALQREYEGDKNANITFHNPRNTHTVTLHFRGEKTAKVMGALAIKQPENGDILSGVLVKRDFKYHILAPSDLSSKYLLVIRTTQIYLILTIINCSLGSSPEYTDMSMSAVTQRLSIAFSGSITALKMLLERIGGPGTVEVVEPDIKYKIFDTISILIDEKILMIEWQATPVTDMYADTVLASLMQTEIVGNTIKASSAGTKPDRAHFKECLVEALQDIYGDNAVPSSSSKGGNLVLTVDGKTAEIDLDALVGNRYSIINNQFARNFSCSVNNLFLQEVTCEEDQILETMLHTTVHKLYQALVQANN